MLHKLLQPQMQYMINGDIKEFSKSYPHKEIKIRDISCSMTIIKNTDSLEKKIPKYYYTSRQNRNY